MPPQKPQPKKTRARTRSNPHPKPSPSLTEHWEAILAAEGLPASPTRLHEGSWILSKYGAQGFAERQAYFYYAQQLANTPSAFPNEQDRHIWSLHADGLSVKSIVTLLKSRHPTLTYRMVWYRLDQIRAGMLQHLIRQQACTETHESERNHLDQAL